MSSRIYSLRLEGLEVPEGEISMRDISQIGSALQLVATRIARQIAGQEGSGRSLATFEKMSELRLVSLSPGSTVLELRLGDDETLALEDAEEHLIAERFEETFSAIAHNSPPTWANSQTLQAIGKVASSVNIAGATRATTSRGVGPTAEIVQKIDVRDLDVSVWNIRTTPETEQVSMTGFLDKVDLRARKFRVRDDVGHDVMLDDVVDVIGAAQLIGTRVIARGVAEHDGARLLRIVEPTLEPEELPDSWFVKPTTEPLVGSPISDGGIAGMTEKDVIEFLVAIQS